MSHGRDHTDPASIPAHARGQHDDFPDIDLEGDTRDMDIPDHVEQQLTDFYDELLQNPLYATNTAKVKAIVHAYASGMSVLDICDHFGVTRTAVALTVRLTGVRRGMDAPSLNAEEAANLYALLYAAQLEIESLRRQLADKNKP